MGRGRQPRLQGLCEGAVCVGGGRDQPYAQEAGRATPVVSTYATNTQVRVDIYSTVYRTPLQYGGLCRSRFLTRLLMGGEAICFSFRLSYTPLSLRLSGVSGEQSAARLPVLRQRP